MFLIGRAAAGPDADAGFSLEDAAAAAALAAALAATHIANQLADERSDRANRKLPYLASGRVSRRAARGLFGASLALFALALPFVSARLAPLALGALALGLAYATPPLLLKTRAGWDLAANALGYGGVAYAIGWGTAAPLEPRALIGGAAPWILAVGAVFAATTVVDAPGDAAARQRTLAVRLGIARARLLAPLLLASAMAIAAATRAPVPLLLAGASLPAALLPLVRPSRAADHLAFQVGAALPALYAGIRFPLFGGVLLVAGLGARAYHAARFGMRYPALGGGDGVSMHTALPPAEPEGKRTERPHRRAAG